MTELIGTRVGACPARGRDNLKSLEELRSCQKQMARACLARRKLTQLGVTPQGEERYQSAWCSRPFGEPMCIIPTGWLPAAMFRVMADFLADLGQS